MHSTRSRKCSSNNKTLNARLLAETQVCHRSYIIAATASDKVYQLLAYGLWFSPGTPASSTTKTGRHDIVDILLKVSLNTINQSINQSIDVMFVF